MIAQSMPSVKTNAQTDEKRTAPTWMKKKRGLPCRRTFTPFGLKLVDAKTTAPGEIRGVSIASGTARDLAPGDVVVIPAGVPHWFERVSNPFTYYVVKPIR